MDPEPEILRKQVVFDDKEAEHATLTVRKQKVGRRIDRYLHGRFPRLSRTLIQRLIRQGDIIVNGKPTKASYEPSKGDVIDLVIPPPEPTEISGEDIPLNIIHEDDHLLAINKQAGIICHPARPSQGGTIANAVVFHAQNLSHGTDPFRPGIVHRLDKNTTGVMLIAKDDETHWRLSLQFEKRTVEKMYLAVVEGTVQLDQDIIDAPLAAHPTIRDRHMVPGMKVLPMVTKPATTRYQVIERFAGYTLVALFPKTGRTHQLRVHMSFLGYPIVGDLVYGGHLITPYDLGADSGDTPIIEHQALHARSIRIVHPIYEETMTLEAPVSDRIESLLELLRTHRSAS
jgi:23S rRNA pseudouridine1911/1915/1917 synthase